MITITLTAAWRSLTRQIFGHDKASRFRLYRDAAVEIIFKVPALARGKTKQEQKQLFLYNCANNISWPSRFAQREEDPLARFLGRSYELVNKKLFLLFTNELLTAPDLIQQPLRIFRLAAIEFLEHLGVTLARRLLRRGELLLDNGRGPLVHWGDNSHGEN